MAQDQGRHRTRRYRGGTADRQQNTQCAADGAELLSFREDLAGLMPAGVWIKEPSSAGGKILGVNDRIEPVPG